LQFLAELHNRKIWLPVIIMTGEKIAVMEDALKNFNKKSEKIAAIAHEFKGNASYFGLDILEKTAKEVDAGYKNKLSQNKLKDLGNQLLKLVKDIVADNS